MNTNTREVLIERLEGVLKKLNGMEEDALLEFGALHQLGQFIDERKEWLKPDAITHAEKLLEDVQKKSGEFQYKNQTFELSLTENFDFVDDVKRYANADGAEYRRIYKERSDLQTLIKSKTKLLKAINDNFKAEHPDWKPDSITYTFKVKKFDFTIMP